MENTKGYQFLPKTADAIFEYDGYVAFVAKANTSASVTISQTKTEKRAGQNNVLIGTIFSDMAIEASLTSASWQAEFLAAEVGSPIRVGKYEFISNDLSITAAKKNEKVIITLPSIPVDKYIHIQLPAGGYAKVEVETTEVNITPYGFNEKDCVKALGLFEYAGKRINLAVDSVPLIGKLTLTSPIYDGAKGKVGKSEYVFPIFQFDGNFTQNYTADATYEMKGNAIATDSGECGQGESYGYYQEYIENEAVLTSYSTIVATPTIIELSASKSDKETLTVYGKKTSLYERVLIPNDDEKLTFTTDKDSVATVSNVGVITAVAAGEAVITVKYNDALTASVKVNVIT